MSSKCEVCKKTAYLMESINISSVTTRRNMLFHDRCFKCCQCKKKLTLSTYKTMNGFFYCESHYASIIARRGDFTGFSSNVEIGPFYKLSDDAITVILSFLEYDEVKSLKLISKRHMRLITSLLDFYPPAPVILSLKCDWPYSDIRVRWYQDKKNSLPLLPFMEDENSISKYYMIEVKPPPTVLHPVKRVYVHHSSTNSMTISIPEWAMISYEHFVVTVSSVTGKYISRSQPGFTLMHNLLTGTGCIDGFAQIKMGDGTWKCLKDVRVGERVISGDNTVQTVLAVYIKESTRRSMVRVNGFWITRGHPIWYQGDWMRPDEIFPGRVKEREVEGGLVNLVIDSVHSVKIKGDALSPTSIEEGNEETICCSLGRYCGDRLKVLYPHHYQLFHKDICDTFRFPAPSLPELFHPSHLSSGLETEGTALQ